jgi:mannose-6-phosphate isomerase-like protein (cupin superfamily)
MIVKKTIASLAEFTAGDATLIKEVLHPAHEGLPIRYSLAQAKLLPGASSYPHVLENQSELYIFIQGSAKVFVGQEESLAEAGDIVWVPPGVRQSVTNIGTTELIFFCVVDPPWQKEDEQILED